MRAAGRGKVMKLAIAAALAALLAAAAPLAAQDRDRASPATSTAPPARNRDADGNRTAGAPASPKVDPKMLIEMLKALNQARRAAPRAGRASRRAGRPGRRRARTGSRVGCAAGRSSRDHPGPLR